MQLQIEIKVLIQDNKSRYLFLIRSGLVASKDAVWDIPTAIVGPSERVEESLSKEMLLHVSFHPMPALRVLHVQDIFAPKNNIHVVRLTYAAQLPEKFTLHSEHQPYKWATLEEALQQKLDPHLREVLVQI